MKLRALIIDDEPLAHDIILEYAKSVPFLDVIGHCHLATEAFVFLNEQEVDLIFLDIQMPKIKGLDFLRTLSSPPLVVVTSAYEEYALESFELDVCDYLHKPFRFDRFLKAVNKALEWHQLKNQSQGEESSSGPSPSSTADPLFIKSDKRHIQLEPKNIFYLESYGNYVKVWLADHFHLTPATLSSFEEQLPDNIFLRIHKSYLINIHQIDYVEGNMVFLKNEKELPVGKNYRKKLKQFFS